MTMSSLVQRQSERQGIFLIALSPLERGAGGVKYLPYPSHPLPPFLFRHTPFPSSCHTPACPGIQVKKIILISSP